MFWILTNDKGETKFNKDMFISTEMFICPVNERRAKRFFLKKFSRQEGDQVVIFFWDEKKKKRMRACDEEQME